MTIPPEPRAAAPCGVPLSRTQFDVILREILPSLSIYARSLARDRELAEDLVQEAAVRAWRNRTSFVAGTNFKAWLYRILRNCFISHIRRGRVAKTDTYGDDFPDVPVASNQEANIFLTDVGRYWAKLAPSQQRAIELIAIDGRSYEEAASLEDISVGTLKSRVSRGRQALLALLDGNVVASVGSPEEGNRLDERPSGKSRSSKHSVSDADRNQIAMLRVWRSQRGGPHAKAA